ncbi:DNA-binding HxlR family transcriptional regulator [Actinoplanes campanulatus]|uniref:DNA-binding HxlR family transcriptional regulator n=1 Tax=Actinoplanes campanulatus TaxID=113559 RepID=A0A7W5FEB4_9ACTN|nr:helix-turn-helix domain-containing protein [Actinoplanes campanulatus]MBB3095333.1 DNA-binding HxlR family transcriptional regulator [Actinoplanes campanulatus]
MTTELKPDMFAPECPTRQVPMRIGDKWTAMIVLCLEDGPRRFGELLVPLSAITKKVLAETLRAMERDGLVTRTEFPANPPHVEYALTPLGRSLLTLIDAARDWCAEHLPELTEARRAYTSSFSAASKIS